ncbi:hypothetical protein TNCV_4885891 [Trichonephila clavipes]|uniref:Uncharacterized protein n=1 Tax=Trichonephila clavipes TaxID=2585209 RepID=A0A8X6RIK6_TRICX|nr:hypothetical protein TNCV_4885891 [Trichonephila clavipes]
MNNSVREGDALPFETSFNLCRAVRGGDAPFFGTCVEVEFFNFIPPVEVGTHRRNRDRNHNFKILPYEEVKSVESKFFSSLYIRASNKGARKKKKRFSSGLHESTAADSVRSEWPLWHAAKSKAVFARRRSKSKPEQKLLDIRLERAKREKGTREVREQALPSAYHRQTSVKTFLPF